MVRATQFKIRWYVVAVVIIGYFCAFPELGVLLGIFIASLLTVAPVLVMLHLVCRFSFGTRRSSNHRP
jgi:hypothetical protein